MDARDDDLVTVWIACEIIGGTENPISRATLWRGVKAGRYPKPIRIGASKNRGPVRWRKNELIAVLEKAASER